MAMLNLLSVHSSSAVYKIPPIDPGPFHKLAENPSRVNFTNAVSNASHASDSDHPAVSAALVVSRARGNSSLAVGPRLMKQVNQRPQESGPRGK